MWRDSAPIQTTKLWPLIGALITWHQIRKEKSDLHISVCVSRTVKRKKKIKFPPKNLITEGEETVSILKRLCLAQASSPSRSSVLRHPSPPPSDVFKLVHRLRRFRPASPYPIVVPHPGKFICGFCPSLPLYLHTYI